MKRLSVAVILLIAVSITAIATHNILKKEINLLSETILNVAETVENGTETELTDAIKAAQKQWNKSGKILHSLVAHGEMSISEQNITAMLETLEFCEHEELVEQCIEALNELKNLNNSYQLSIENIL